MRVFSDLAAQSGFAKVLFLIFLIWAWREPEASTGCPECFVGPSGALSKTKIKQSVGNRTKKVKQNDLVTDVGRLGDLMGSRVSDVAKPYDFISLLIQRVSGTRGRPG